MSIVPHRAAGPSWRGFGTHRRMTDLALSARLAAELVATQFDTVAAAAEASGASA